MKLRARIERAGSKSSGYAPGWFAIPTRRHVTDGEGEWFPTWREAMEHALGGPLVGEATA